MRERLVIEWGEEEADEGSLHIEVCRKEFQGAAGFADEALRSRRFHENTLPSVLPFQLGRTAGDGAILRLPAVNAAADKYRAAVETDRDTTSGEDFLRCPAGGFDEIISIVVVLEPGRLPAHHGIRGGAAGGDEVALLDVAFI